MRKSVITRISRFELARQTESGLALLAVIAILTVLLMMGATFALLMRMERRSAINLAASEKARVDARNRLDMAIQVLETHRAEFDALHTDTEWYNMSENDDDLTIIDLDSRINVNAMGRLGEILGDEIFFSQKIHSTDSYMSRVIEAALLEAEDAGDLDMDVGDIPVFAELLADMVVRARYGEDETPGQTAYNDIDRENRLGFVWGGWDVGADDDGMGYDIYGTGLRLGLNDLIPNAMRGPDGAGYSEPNVAFDADVDDEDAEYNPEIPVGDDQPFSSFWQVVPIIERALDDYYGVDDGPDYYTQVIEALEPDMGIHSHTRSPDYIDINAAIPELMVITNSGDDWIYVDRKSEIPVGSLAGRTVRIISGAADGEQLEIEDNFTDSGEQAIRVVENWNTPPPTGSICIVVEDWAPYENPYDRLFHETGIYDWVVGDPPVRRDQARRLIANLIDFKDENDIPTQIDIDGNGIMVGPGWSPGGDIYGAEGLHITEIMPTVDRVETEGDGSECIDSGDGTPNPPADEYWQWDDPGNRWIQMSEVDPGDPAIEGTWRFTGLKTGWYAIRIYGGNGNNLTLDFDGLQYTVTTDRMHGSMYFANVREPGGDLAAVEVDEDGELEFDIISENENDIFYTIQLLPQYIEITNIAMQSPLISGSHGIDISNWRLFIDNGSGTHSMQLPLNQVVPAARPDGYFPLNYGTYIIAMSRNAYEAQWGDIDTADEAVMYAMGDESDTGADWLVNHFSGDLSIELRYNSPTLGPIFGIVAGGAVDGAVNLSPLEYVAHQKTSILGSGWQPFGNLASSDDTDEMLGSQLRAIVATVEYGWVEDASDDTFTAFTQTLEWADDRWVERVVEFVAGAMPDDDRARRIESNTANTITIGDIVEEWPPKSGEWPPGVGHGHTPPGLGGDWEPISMIDETTRYEIRWINRTWLNERYTDLWREPGEEFKTLQELREDRYTLPIILNRPYHSRAWVGLVPSGTPWRTIDSAQPPGYNRDNPEDLLGLLMSRTRTSGAFARVNINTASENVLKGIFDDEFAELIIAIREAEGPWRSWDRLLNEPELAEGVVSYLDGGNVYHTFGFFPSGYHDSGAVTYCDDFPDDSDEREEFFRRFGDLIDIRSSAFLIRASGSYHDPVTDEEVATAVIEAVVDRQRDTTGDGYANCSIVEFRYVTEAD